MLLVFLQEIFECMLSLFFELCLHCCVGRHIPRAITLKWATPLIFLKGQCVAQTVKHLDPAQWCPCLSEHLIVCCIYFKLESTTQLYVLLTRLNMVVHYLLLCVTLQSMSLILQNQKSTKYSTFDMMKTNIS